MAQVRGAVNVAQLLRKISLFVFTQLSYLWRDFNVSLNILSLGLQTLGFSAPGSSRIYSGE